MPRARPLARRAARAPGGLIGPGSARLPQHPDEHRPERPVLLAVDQEFGEGAGGVVPSIGADRVRSIKVGEAEDVEELGAWSGAEGLPGAPVHAVPKRRAS